MNHSSESYISHNLIVSDIATKSGDKEYKYSPEGYYISLIQEALQELSFDTFFIEKEKYYDIEAGCLKFEMPTGAFNVREIFVFNGDKCNPSGKQNVWYKRNYANKLSRNDFHNQRDPFYRNQGMNPPGNVYFAGVRNGVIELSPNCASFTKLVIRFNGLLCDVGETPVIPMFFRQAVVDFGVVSALSTRIAEVSDTSKIQAWQYILNRHEMKMNKPFTGSWDTARHRSKIMDRKSREDMTEYFSRLDARQY